MLETFPEAWTGVGSLTPVWAAGKPGAWLAGAAVESLPPGRCRGAGSTPNLPRVLDAPGRVYAAPRS